MTRIVKILVVGQTPPPLHGQAMMIECLVNASLEKVKLYHVRMAFSDTIDDVGRFRIGKTWHLLSVIGRIVWQRFAHGIDVLYYPPAGPNRIPLVRDIAILGCTRWLFRKTIFHFHILGIGHVYQGLPLPVRWLARFALFGPDVAICLSNSATADAKMLGSRRISIVPNGIDDQFTRGRSLRNHRETPRLRILFVGILCESKGASDLVSACAILNGRGVPFKLELVGAFKSSEFEQRLRNQIEQLHLQEQIHFAGSLSGDVKWNAFARSDVLCLPTHYGCAGRVVGSDVVRTPCNCNALWCNSTNRRRWHHGVFGDDQRRGDAGSATSTIARSAQFALQMGRMGRAKFLREYTAARHLQRMEEVFVDVFAPDAISCAAMGNAMVEGET